MDPEDVLFDAIDVVVMNNAAINNGIIQIINDVQPLAVAPQRRVPTRNEDYFEITIPAYTLDEFREHFRMSRGTMQTLLEAIVVNIRGRRSPVINISKKLLLTIWLLGKPESFLACGDRFGVSKGTAHYIFSEMVGIISGMINDYIIWPNQQKCHENAEVFREKSGGIPNVIGAIDGCHIFIKQPVGNAVDYYNRYQSHSIILQGVCDAKRRFINISVGHPGRIHDARVFRRSMLYGAIFNEENPLINRNQHIIGDAAYPLLQELLTPFRNNGHLSPAQLRYNVRFSKIRSIIERTFALLKGKWRRLKYLDMSDIDLMQKVVTACCVIHNIILQNDDMQLEGIDIDDDIENIPNIDQNERRRHALGEIKRTEIVNILN